MTRIAVSQSNYIPWIGYFEMISSVSDFVFLDNVQYTHRDWRSRNQIKTPQGKLWLNLEVKAEKNSLIQDAILVRKDEKFEHLDKIRRNYRRSRFFDEIFPEIEEIYGSYGGNSLSEFNQHLIESLSRKLGIATRFHNARDFPSETDASRRILEICKSLKAATYVSGPSAHNYLDLELFKSHQIEVEWFKYSNKPHEQLWGDFDQTISILDPILNNGWNVFLDRGDKL
jgi:hypothetical protein